MLGPCLVNSALRISGSNDRSGSPPGQPTTTRRACSAPIRERAFSVTSSREFNKAIHRDDLTARMETLDLVDSGQLCCNLLTREPCRRELSPDVPKKNPARAGLSEVGGTGLEPVTPSLSSWCSPN